MKISLHGIMSANSGLFDKGIYGVFIKELLNNRVQTTHQTFIKELSI